MTASSTGSRLSREQVEEMILAASVKAGWIDEADLAAEPEIEGEERRAAPEEEASAAEAHASGAGA